MRIIDECSGKINGVIPTTVLAQGAVKTAIRVNSNCFIAKN